MAAGDAQGDAAGHVPPVPEMDPPQRWCPTAWDGDWQATHAWHTGMDPDDQGEPVWFREFRLLDGHEDCCNHRDFVVVERQDPAASAMQITPGFSGDQFHQAPSPAAKRPEGEPPMADLDPLIDALTDLLDEWDGEGLIDGDETLEHFLADGLTRKGWSFQPPHAASTKEDDRG